MFNNQIEIWHTQIAALNHKVKDGTVHSRLLVAGVLDTKLAEDLGIKNLVFANNGTPKEGFSKLELSTNCHAFRAVFEAEGLRQTFEITGDNTDNFLVERVTDEKHGSFRLKFRLNYHGDPHQALAYVLAVGSAESSLKVVPLQQELDASDATDLSVRATREDGSTEEFSIPKETVRKALGAKKKHASRSGRSAAK